MVDIILLLIDEYMSEEILNKLIEHDTKFLEHDRRFDEHDRRFDEHDRRFDEIDRKFVEHDKRFDLIDSQIDFLAKKAIEHDEQFEWLRANMATKADMAKLTKTMDYIVKIYEKHEQEITMMSHGNLRLTERVERLEKFCDIA